MLQPTDTTAIPAMTHLVAHAAFPNGSLAIRLRDAFGPIFNDAAFAELYPALGQSAESPARLAMVTILQFVDNLPDRVPFGWIPLANPESEHSLGRCGR